MNDFISNSAAVWTEHRLKELFAGSADVQIVTYRFSDSMSSEIVIVYAEGLCDADQLGRVVLPDLQRLYERSGFKLSDGYNLFGAIPVLPMTEHPCEQDIIDSVFQGDLLLLLTATHVMFKLNICKRPGRQPEESSTEISIKGPKDGFTEDICTNVALIRKRIRSNSLCYETKIIGRRTRTKVGLLYFRDIINPELLNEVRKRLDKIDIDGLYSISQLEEVLSDVKYSLFPLMEFSGRPDFAVGCLLAGRFVLLIDGNPFILTGPAGLSLILKSPEDIHFNYAYISFARIIRFISFWISIVLPGFWVAISAFHQDQFPFRFMATISLARLGLPLSAQMEMFLLLLLLEIFREAGVRLPTSIGQTLTVVGGLVIGDAAIRAGLVSPSVVVVGSVTAVMGVTLVNQTLSTTVSVFRFIIFIISSLLGMYGLILSFIMLLFYMSRLTSFGKPYFSPLSPLMFHEMVFSFLRPPWSKIIRRPAFLHTIDSDHKEEDNS